MNNNLGYSHGGREADAGSRSRERAEFIRVICAELNRIASHLIAFGTYGLDIGAFTPFFYAFREREWMMALFEKICGARLTYSYIRIGGVLQRRAARLARGGRSVSATSSSRKWKEYDDLLSSTRSSSSARRTSA